MVLILRYQYVRKNWGRRGGMQGLTERATHTLSADVPALSGAAHRLLAALAAVQPAWPAPPHLLHGDFSASHVYLAASTTTVIDWDSWEVGDCAEDAGRFLASLHHLAARDPQHRGAAGQAAAMFARTYQAALPRAGQRLAFYEAWACLRKAAWLAADGRSDHRRHAEVLLGAGERVLRGGPQLGLREVASIWGCH
jgi:aminoglycoside phosphotransferase (APT) family kinase protein